MTVDASAIVGRALVDPAGWAHASAGVDVASLIEAAVRHRILLLLGWTLRAAGRLHDSPPEFVETFQRAERAAVIEDAVRHTELVHVLEELSAAGVRALLFKGAALAHRHYPAAYLRVRADTDLLVPATDLPMLERVLGRLGYVHPAETSGRLVSYQCHYHRIDRHGIAHAFDVHWKISNLQVLADRFCWEELWRGRVGVDALGSAAVTPDDVHALLLALVHRAGHHPGSHNLLWIYDLHVLASRLRPEEMTQLQEIGSGSRARAGCGRGARTRARPVRQPRCGRCYRCAPCPPRRRLSGRRDTGAGIVDAGARATPRSRRASQLAGARPPDPGAPRAACKLHARAIWRPIERSASRLVLLARAGRCPEMASPPER